jgi:carbonic anhydrase/acetyltransferase-like protein (isoleucine patch superfamily)
MLIEHQGKRPSIHESAFVAPSAVVCGDVKIGPRSQVAFSAVIVAQGGSVVIGAQSIIRENAVIRATPRHSVHIGNYVLVGPNAALYGCVVGDEAFLATGVSIFHGARIGKHAEVRINGVVHINSALPEKAMVPIGWVAVGDPAQVLPPNEHERIWAIQERLNFPLTVYGVERSPDGSVDMKEITRRLAESLAEHRHDQIMSKGNHSVT